MILNTVKKYWLLIAATVVTVLVVLAMAMMLARSQLSVRKANDAPLTEVKIWTLRLSGCRGCGYTWECTINNPDVLEKIDQQIDDSMMSPGLIGGHQDEVFTFRGLSPGMTGVDCVYSRPWEDEDGEHQHYLVSVDQELLISLF